MLRSKWIDVLLFLGVIGVIMLDLELLWTLLLAVPLILILLYRDPGSFIPNLWS